MVGVDGTHQLEIGVAGDSPADRAAHPPTGAEDTHAHRHGPAPYLR